MVPSSLHRSGTERALQSLARQVLLLSEGSRLPSTQDLQATINVGAGTVQKTFGLLEDLGALTTRARGRQGRFVEHRDLGALWRLAEFPPVKVFVTPPGASEVYGLIRSLRSAFQEMGIPLEFEHVRGAETRVERARTSTCGVAIISGGLANTLADPPVNGLQQHRLGSGTYYAPDSVVVLSRPGVDTHSPHTRIGVDPSSHDHRRISQAHYGSLGTRQTIPVAFPHVPRALLEGSIDSGVWHRMLLVISPELVGITVSALSPEARRSMQGMTEAVLVYPTDRPFLRAALDAVHWDALEQNLSTAIADATVNGIDTWYR